jgi:hypothetical protein
MIICCDCGMSIDEASQIDGHCVRSKEDCAVRAFMKTDSERPVDRKADVVAEVEPILQFFEFHQLGLQLQEVSRPCRTLAHTIINNCLSIGAQDCPPIGV